MKKNELKLLLIKDINEVTNALLELTSGNSPLFDNIILVKARFNDLTREDNKGVLNSFEKNIEMNKIRGSILRIINSLNDSEPIEDTSNLNKSKTLTPKFDTSNEEEDDELGLFELEDLFLISAGNLTESIERMAKDIQEMEINIVKDTNKLNTIVSSKIKSSKTMVTKIISNASKTLIEYRNRLDVEIPIFKESTESSVNYILQYISKLYELDINSQKDDVIEFAESIKILKNAAKESRILFLGMYEELKKVPGLTSEFIKAKKKVLKSLDHFFKDYDQYLEDLTLVDKNVDTILLEISNE